LDFLGGEGINVLVVLSVSRWRLDDFLVEDVEDLSLSPGRWMELVIEQLGWRLWLWFSMARVSDAVDCSYPYFLWQSSWFLVEDLRSQSLAVNSFSCFIFRGKGTESLGEMDTYTVAVASNKPRGLTIRLLVSWSSESLSRQMITQQTKLTGSLSQWLIFQLRCTASRAAA